MLTLAEVKDWLKKSDTLHDNVLDALRLRAIEAVQRELDWYFSEPRPTIEILDGTGTAALWLRQPPSDGSVTVSTRGSLAGGWSTVDPADYELDGRGLFHGALWLRGLRNYRAQYMEGFDDAPGDVKQFTLDLIAAKWRDPQKAGVVSETLGRYSYTLGDLMESDQWTQVRNNWRRGRI